MVLSFHRMQRWIKSRDQETALFAIPYTEGMVTSILNMKLEKLCLKSGLIMKVERFGRWVNYLCFILFSLHSDVIFWSYDLIFDCSCWSLLLIKVMNRLRLTPPLLCESRMSMTMHLYLQFRRKIMLRYMHLLKVKSPLCISA